MAIDNCGKDLTNNFGSHFLGENTAVNNLIEELATLAVLGHKVKEIGILVVLKQTHDIWVLQLSEDIVLLILIDALFLLDCRLLDFLDCADLIRAEVDGFSDLAKTSLTDDLQGLEVLHDISIGDKAPNSLADLVALFFLLYFLCIV
jgi:hypothetical protein